jgi:SecD/SecF fusion protein
MEKRKRWQFILILSVMVLTLYNILPTVFFYTKPLHEPINEKRAAAIALADVKRVNSLEEESKEWIGSFSKLLKIKPTSITLDPKQPEYITIAFQNAQDAKKFRDHLPRAGALIPFYPMQMTLYGSAEDATSKNVVVKRNIPIHFDPSQITSFFQFSPKTDAQGNVSPLYRALVSDRTLELGVTLGGVSENAAYVNTIVANPTEPQSQELMTLLSQNILTFTQVFGENSAIAKRYFASFTQTDTGNREQTVKNLIHAIDLLKDKSKLERLSLQEEGKKDILDSVKQQRLDLLLKREKTLASAETIIKNHQSTFAAGQTPWNYTSLGVKIQEGIAKAAQAKTLEIPLADHNPFIEKVIIDWANEKIYLHPYADLIAFRNSLDQSTEKRAIKEKLDQFLYNEIALIARQSGEAIAPSQDDFEVALNHLSDSKSFIALRLSSIATAQAKAVKESLIASWAPKHPDLKKEVFPVWDYDTYQSLPLEQKKLGLVVYAPSTYTKMPARGFRMNSIYVIAKGLDKVLQKVNANPKSENGQQFMSDFNKLRELMAQHGFMGYPGSTLGVSSGHSGDYIFEAEDYFLPILKATREDFTVHGTKRYAVLEFTDVEQRILTENKIGTRMHEDLLKWRDDYRAAQLQIKGASLYDVPAPTKNALWDNFKLSLVKYFRGDDRKVLHWGLDLSGGKTVQIELRDTNNKRVTDEVDIKQGINELYNRVNKMGVSEVGIRQEGDFITLDFPGSQSLSAADLVKASSMYFHVVNEKFSSPYSPLGQASQQFLQEVWNEAVVTNRKDADEINQIAWRHLYGESLDTSNTQSRSESAKILFDNGLRLSNPQDTQINSVFNNTLSKISVQRGENYTDWDGQTHPLLIVFRNYALEGSSLEDVHASYDPSKGNYLSFSVKGSQTSKEGVKSNARDDFSTWTGYFSKEKITGTPNEAYSKGRGWRMAVILNGTVISSPTLESALRDHAMISGSFTQREINQLEADLKAGSLSFTPRILSEKNVSPELGSHERTFGIIATVIALGLVMFAMIGYYRFGGLVATVAVLFNLLLMWATLQNLQAAMTLAGIAGMILTLGMAVDANVLVFERIREEFAISGRIASAIHAGYKKAFTAILDSNVTTIIAGLILLNFESGPIKAFAVMLIIGIVSSMFTALFLTRFFFAGWVQNPEHKELKMMNWIKTTSFNFLKYTRKTIIFSTAVIVLGGILFVAQKQTIIGMDFTGGYALNLELKEDAKGGYRQKVEQALIAQGVTAQDFQIRELTPSNNIRLFLGRSLEQKGRPFYNMPATLDLKEAAYPFQTNPKIVWIVNALNKSQISLSPRSLATLDKNWSAISGQMSESMRNNAFIGLLIALVCILVYITIRFEFKYAISATICLAHDVIFTLAAIAILYRLGVPVQIDLNTVAALMTIVGYSLNDTIIVFDRIREDVRIMRHATFREIINHALNTTLSRTLMTSGTTLLVLIPLIALGGSTIFGFALVMAIGVIFGTLSSLFIAAPLMEYFHKREITKQPKLIVTEE